MNKKILVYVVLGAAAGLLLAEFFPALGMGKGEKFVTDIGRAFGADKPYLRNASIGAIVGGFIGFFSKK